MNRKIEIRVLGRKGHETVTLETTLEEDIRKAEKAFQEILSRPENQGANAFAMKDQSQEPGRKIGKLSEVHEGEHVMVIPPMRGG